MEDSTTDKANHVEEKKDQNVVLKYANSANVEEKSQDIVPMKEEKLINGANSKTESGEVTGNTAEKMELGKATDAKVTESGEVKHVDEVPKTANRMEDKVAAHDDKKDISDKISSADDKNTSEKNVKNDNKKEVSNMISNADEKNTTDNKVANNDKQEISNKKASADEKNASVSKVTTNYDKNDISEVAEICDKRDVEKAKASTNKTKKKKNTSVLLNDNRTIPERKEVVGSIKNTDISNLSETKQVETTDHKTELNNEHDKEGTTARSVIDPAVQYHDKVITGTCTFTDLPPLAKKVVRIFISSTFTDTQAERNALMQKVYPKLADYCREKHGLEFQVVDMRWGVPEQASDNHSTSELCIQEIKKCQEVSVGPNFVALVGDKYGYRPIPSDIDEKLFTELQKAAPTVAGIDWNTIEEWYKRDCNAIPAVYLLQPISSKLPHYNNKENQELRRESQDKWNTVNQTLTSALRKTSDAACKAGYISDKDKEQFFVSVTENEISEGILWKPNQSKESCFCIIRKIEDIEKYVSDPKAPRFTDLTSTKTFDEEARNLLKQLQDEKLIKALPDSNLLKLDIEWLVSGANITVENINNPAKTAVTNKKQHKDYIDEVCNHFFETLSKMIEDGSNKQKNLYSPLITELLQHWHLTKTRCEVFEGRVAELHLIREYLLSKDLKAPLIVHGSSGCGKTSVMAKVIECICEKEWVNCENFIIVPRFLGTTPNTSNLHQLLVSLCNQLSNIYSLQWEEPEKMKDLIELFHKLLERASIAKPLVILLDSIDQLMPAYNAFKLKWLPATLPANVKILASTIDEGYPIYQAFKDRYFNEKYSDVKVDSLGEKLGLQVISKWLSKDKRKMTDQQESAIKELLLKCSLPLYARIAYDQIKRWKSYDIPDVKMIEPTVKGAINKLFLSMEEKFGLPMVKHSLSYLTASRHGMSEAELEHVLSLDDMLLNAIFKLWIPPVRRVPPLLWTRIRTEIHSYIVERSADDILVLNWYHRQFIETTKLRYLSDNAFSHHIHDHMVQFFTGKWGGGKEKPFEYTEAQVKRFGLQDSKSTKDRKVPRQPFMTEYVEDEKTELRFNKRKLSEVPFHLIKTKNYETLKTNVFFKYEWLYAKLKSSTIQQVLEEFEIFMQADKIVKEDSEIKVLYANLQLMRPYLHKYPDSLPYELSGRLARYVGSSNSITSLIKDCDSKGINTCSFVPMLTCFETANIGFSQNIKFRSSDSWVEGGAICCSSDFQTMYILDYSDEGLPLLLLYDIISGEKINTLNITKPEEGTRDMYSKIIISVNKKEILGFYRQSPEGKTQKKFREKYGLIDVIDIETGNVVSTHEGFILHRFFVNPLLYMTENVICVGFLEKVPFINIRTAMKKEMNKPTLLDSNEEYFIVCDRDKTNLRQYKNKEQIAEFDVTEPQIAVGGTTDFSLIIMIEAKTYTTRLYDIKSRVSHLTTAEGDTKAGHLIKCKKAVTVTDDKMKTTVDGLFNSVTETDERDASNRQRAHIIISPTKDSFIVIYGGTWRNWVTYLYSINMSSWNVKYIGPVIEEEMTTTDRYPVYCFDGANIVIAKDNIVDIISTKTGQSIHKYKLNENVKDFAVSDISNKLAVMFPKSVLMLAIPEAGYDTMQLQDNKNSDQQEKKMKKLVKNNISQESKLETIKAIVHDSEDKNVSTLLHQVYYKGHTQPELVLKHSDDHYVLKEIHSLAAYADTDRIASARSKRKHAVYKAFSPNGLQTIHYHTKVQVVDTKNEIIMYTPKKGDVILRTIVKEGTSTNKTIQIPGLDDAGSRIIELNLQDGDRIVHDGNKVKFRVNQDLVGQMKIMNVPSVLSVYSVQDSKLRKLQSVTVFRENVLTVSNNFILTSKDTSHGHFVNIYNQVDGKLLATHEIKYQVQAARLSADEAQLFVVDAGLCLTGYIGPLFNSLEVKMQLIPDETQTNIKFSVKDILMFDLNRNDLVVCYGTDKTSVSAEKMYISVDTASKIVSKSMSVTPSLEDISEHGLFGIDSSLNVFDLKEGTVKFQLPYADLNQTSKGNGFMQVIARFSGDKHVVIVNKQDDTLHLSSIESEPKHLFSCFCHTPNLLLNNGMSVVNYGQNLILRSPSHVMCFAILPELPDGNLIMYNDEKARALSLMLAWCDQHQIPQMPSKERESIFSKRKLLVQQMNMENKMEEKPVVKEFQIENPDKPQVLVVSESLLSTYFVPSNFSKYLKTEKLSALSAEVATNKINSIRTKYDVIILQLITDDVPKYDIKSCVDKVSSAVDSARTKARMVLLSLAPCRGDGAEINKKSQEVNGKLAEKYSTVKDVHLCSNDNLGEKGKPFEKYFQDGVTLSAAGVKQISVNYKDVLFPILAEHYWVGQKKNPNLQTSGNKIV